MGTTAWWIIRYGTEPVPRSVVPTHGTVEHLGERGGWRFEELEIHDLELVRFDRMIADLGRSAPAVGGFVFDSDFAYLVAVAPGLEPARLVRGLQSAETYGSEAVELLSSGAGISGLVDWSRLAPVRLSESTVAEIQGRVDVFAEDLTLESSRRPGSVCRRHRLLPSEASSDSLCRSR